MKQDGLYADAMKKVRKRGEKGVTVRGGLKCRQRREIRWELSGRDIGRF